MFLQFNNVQIGYDEILIDGFSATLDRGEVCLLMGNNGIGKTTLIKTILGQIPTLGGDILIDNEPLTKLSVQEISKKIAVVFSKAEIPLHYTTFDLVALGRIIYYPYYISLNQEDRKKIDEIIRQLSLEKYRDTPLKKLSDGNLQKAFIGRAMAQDSPLIILDEPTTHLDEQNKIMILKTLQQLTKNQGKTILFSSHDWRLAKHFSDKIWYIKDKKLYQNTAQNLTQEHQELAVFEGIY